MILCCPNNVVWIAIFAVLCEIAPLSLSQGNPPAQLIRPIWAAPKCAQGKRHWQWNMTYQTYQYNVSGKKRWISMIPPAGKKSVNVKSHGVAPLLPLWILNFDTSKPWSFGTGSATVSTQPKVYKWVGKMEFNDFKPWCAHWPARSLHIGRTDTTKICIMEDVKSVESNTESVKLSRLYTPSEHGSQGSPSQDEKSEERLLVDQNAHQGERNSEIGLVLNGKSNQTPWWLQFTTVPEPRSAPTVKRAMNEKKFTFKDNLMAWCMMVFRSGRNGRKAIVDAKGEMWRFMSLYER